jgi:lysine 2,3-aminomutase
LGEKASSALISDIETGLLKTPMNIRLTPYVFSRIHWENFESDPVRRQFLPLGSQFIPDHPYVMDDSLAEDGHKATPYLTHRYPDKALFLPITLCPVYCSFCTRSRVVGGSTAVKSKSTYGAKSNEWDSTFEYIRNHSDLEDIVISGGDALLLRPNQVREIGTTLLEIPTVRRIRFATKGLAIMPMKFTSDTEWVEALNDVCQLGREKMKEVALHTHFNTDREITAWTSLAMETLSETGVRVRNQSVLISGVNDAFDCLHYTAKKLSSQLIQPYYIYLHDMVPGCEHLRTTVRKAENLSRRLQGAIAGFNTPRMVCDAPGGGGKREISSYTLYDEEIGVSAWTSPTAKPGDIFYYYDPIEKLPKEGRDLWANDTEINRRLVKFKANAEAEAEATRT